MWGDVFAIFDGCSAMSPHISYLRKLYARGVKATKGRKPPSDGSMVNLVHQNGGYSRHHFQVEWVHDTRFRPKPWVVVYLWEKGTNFRYSYGPRE